MDSKVKKGILSNEAEEKKALLISVYSDTRKKELCQEHLDELELLCETYGVHVLAKVPCLLRKFEPATLITKGKIDELLEHCKELGVNTVIFDDEISPAQQRNLEKIFDMDVMDRTGVIIGVFAQRALTKEACLQIELAKTAYEAPRLKRLWTHLSRQAGTAGGGGGGGGGYLKGEGEKQIEIDKRIIKSKINKLQNELEDVRAVRQTQRAARKRSGVPVFAIVGYTNAGKSTLLNALTDAGIFTEDKLFATLDTTTRKFTLSNNQEILLIDTVGFIRKLPHQLVEAFKGTLEEAVEADILIHLIDSSHPMAEEQAETTVQVLHELGAKDKQMITVLNKIDRLEDNSILTKFRIKYPKVIGISAKEKQGFHELQEIMIDELKKQRRTMKLRIPQSEYHRIGEINRVGRIISQDYEENDIVMNVEVPVALAGKLEPYSVE